MEAANWIEFWTKKCRGNIKAQQTLRWLTSQRWDETPERRAQLRKQYISNVVKG